MYMCKAVAPMLICALMEHARIQKILSGGSKFPEGVWLKISTWQKLITWQFKGGGGGGESGSGPPVPPSGSAHVERAGFLTAFLVYEWTALYTVSFTNGGPNSQKGSDGKFQQGKN